MKQENELSYKGYRGHFEYNQEANLYHGQVLDIRDVITFQGNNLDELKEALKDSIEDYLDMCKTFNKMPDKPFSGIFNLHIPPELHRRIAAVAASRHTSIDDWVTEAIEKALNS